MTRYYLGSIDERNGEREYSTRFTFTIFAEITTPDEHLDDTAKNWYGDGCDDEDSDDGYWFCGEVRVTPGDYIEISEATYNEIKGFL